MTWPVFTLLRRLWRRVRALPMARGLILAGDRLWWARRIRHADVVDLDFVAAQLGREVSARRAVREYVRGGWRTGMSLNPLLLEPTVMRVLSDDERVPALYAYLVNDRADVSLGPAWDAPAAARRDPIALDDPAGPLGSVWRAGRAGGGVRLGRDGSERLVEWDSLAAELSRVVRVGARGGTVQLGVEPGAASLTVLCIVAGDESDPGQALRDAVELAALEHAALVIEVLGRSATLWATAALLSFALPDALIRLSTSRTAADAIAESTAADREGVLVVRGPHAEITRADLADLASAGRDRPTAPLWLAPDGTVAAAGVGARDGVAIPLLAQLPAEDARRAGEEIDVPEIAGNTFAAPLGRSAPARTLTRLTAIAPSTELHVPPIDGPDLNRLLAPSGLEVAEWTGPIPQYRRRVSTVTLVDGREVPRLRWSIKTSAPIGRVGELWGDTHFARGLAAALERLGQLVAVDAGPAAVRESDRYDDVSLVLRGPHRIDPREGVRSLQWIISHPNEITGDELGRFDRVFAASAPWATSMSASSGVLITPLLQCTDAERFHPTGSPRGNRIVFVGTARGIVRPSVVEPIRAGIPVEVYGPDWRAFIPASSIVATSLPHSELPGLYESAAVVLNDHWPAMQRAGFIANRPFDVVAAGGRVISDHVDGIDELFEGAVRSWRSVPELIDMLSSDLDAVFPSERTLREISDKVRAEHSFDARAMSLLDAALELG